MGKTSLALKVLNDVCAEGTYELVIWFSARDIDLITDGAKQVKPKVFTAAEIAAEFVRVTDEGAFEAAGADKQTDYFAQALSKSPFGPTLYVFDNFETLRNPVELYTWIDTYVRPPNKVLITTRHREFKGDYPIEVLGMTEAEANELIDHHSTQLGIHHIIEDDYREQLYRESGGHPYVIKVLLGEVAKANRCVNIERIVADREDVLTALFERTFAVLSPAAQRVFLTLCNWRSTIPQLALEAVMLRPGIEKLDVEGAIDELVRFSFIDTSTSATDSERFISVPLTATVFGEKKLSVNPMKAAIQADTSLLHLFGAAQKTDIRHGVGPRIDRLLRTVAARIVYGKQPLELYLPMLEFVAGKHPPAWLRVAELQEELGDLNSAKGSTRRYLENSRGQDAQIGWTRLAELARRTGDGPGELQALVELASVPNVDFNVVSDAANRANQLLRDHWLAFQIGEKGVLLERLMEVGLQRLDEADATDCSRFAWIALHMRNDPAAKKFVEQGLFRDVQNFHCKKLALQLGVSADSVSST
jgi:hypothetical protein